MLIRIALVLIVVPLVELVLLLLFADLTGFGTTLAMVVATGFFGAWLLRRQGLKTFQNIRSELQGGRLPPHELMDGVLILVAGALMLTPGVLTDIVGIALLIPQTRSIFRRWLSAYFLHRLRQFRFSKGSPEIHRPVEIIDSYVVSPTEEKKA